MQERKIDQKFFGKQRTRALRAFLLLPLVLLVSAAKPVEKGLPQVFYGDVYDRDGNLLFRETHNVTRRHQQVIEIKTEIFDLQNRPLVLITSDFTSSRYLPNLFSERLHDGLIARAIKENEKITLLKKEHSWHQYLAKTYQIEPDMVVGHGYYFYLIDHMDELLKSEEKTSLSILIPNRLSKENFYMEVAIDSENSNIASVTLVPKNPFHRMVIPKVVIRIDLSNQWLVSYEGPNSFIDMKKIIPYIKIQYHE
jgi:hypothetical protein